MNLRPSTVRGEHVPPAITRPRHASRTTTRWSGAGVLVLVMLGTGLAGARVMPQQPGTDSTRQAAASLTDQAGSTAGPSERALAGGGAGPEPRADSTRPPGGVGGAGPAARSAEARAALARGQALLAAGRLAEAEQALLEATRAEPDNVLAWNILGQARYEARRWDAALAAFERALSLAPAEARLYGNAANCLYELQRFDQAIASLDKAVALDSHYAAAHMLRGRIASERGDPARAEQELRAAAALGPRDPMAAYFLGMFLFKARRYGEARQAFEQCLRLSPDMASAHLNLGLTLLRSGEPADGRRHLDRFRALADAQLASERLRMDITRRLSAARLEMEAGHLGSALALAQEARDLAPQQAAAHAFLAEIYTRQGRAEDGARERSEAERLARQAGSR